MAERTPMTDLNPDGPHSPERTASGWRHPVSDGTAAITWLRQQIEGDLTRARHILDVRGAHPDPRREMHDAIADCEAKLEILCWHHILTSDDTDYEEFSIYRFPSHPYDFGCVCCHYYAQGAVRNYGYCGTVKALASAYRHREGYAGHWGTGA